MKLFSKRILAEKPYDEVLEIIKSFSSSFPKRKFFDGEFSIYSPKRFNGGTIALFPLKGIIQSHDDHVEVNVWFCADFGFFLGCFLCILGIIELFRCISAGSNRWVPCVGIVLFGIFAGAQSIWEGKALLDRLEHRLNL